MRADVARHAIANRRFRRTYPGFALPPAEFLFETTITTNALRYFLSGQERAQYILRTAVEHLSEPTLRILEWGCGTARISRHLPFLDSTRSVEVFGSDYSERLVTWCRRNVPRVTFVHNELEPPLPFDDASFDMAFSSSVFTHLSPEVQKRWLDEQLRVVRPGGIILFSVHGDAYRSRLLGDELTAYDTRGVVLRGEVLEGSTWYTTYQRPRQVQTELLGSLEVVHRHLHGEDSAPAQDTWVVRRP
jgi:SAM-dependent methyltransferase